MANPFETWAARKGVLSEVYEVVRTAEIVVNREIYRVEIQKCYSNPNTPYVARYLMLETITVQPSYPSISNVDGREFEREPEDINIWKHIDMPWVSANDPDEALEQAFGWFEEAVRTR